MTNTDSASSNYLRMKRPQVPIVPAHLVRPKRTTETPLTVVIKSGDESILPPGTKIALVSNGVPLPKRVIAAAEVASQISRQVLLGTCRKRDVVRWRWALYFALREVFPSMSGARAAQLLNRDHTTMLHADWVKQRNPKLLRDKIAAIMEVLV